ncbi:MAG TPA: DNA repair protein RecO [Gemmatimonadaceae bacterium]|nr:DNA repair protein RecO [Gemmatimonadaceae bacterium]
MPLLSTDAIVLHAFPYSETSRILRLATREAGVQSVLARGARRAKSRFGSALDLFAQGTAQLYLKEGRDLQTLGAFDVTRARPALAADLGRFAGASAVAELVLRFGTAGDVHASLFDALAEALDRVAAAAPERASEAALAGAWRLVAELGFAPSLEGCSVCHAPIPDASDLPFSHVAGGILCAACARLYPGGRTLPAGARACIAAWSGAGTVEALGAREARAHQRLLREFLQQHLADGRALHAFDAWEHGGWSMP